jgi:subtilisin family serine protease
MEKRERAFTFTALLFLLLTGVASGQAEGELMSARLQKILASASPAATQVIWVYFRDKGDAEERLVEGRSVLSSRALDRRSRRGGGRPLVGFEDVPPVPEYVEAVRQRVERVRHISRWLNAVSVEADGSQIVELRRLPFVRRLDVVRRYRRGRIEPSFSTLRSKSLREKSSNRPIDYGSSFGQLEQINVPAVHDMGLDGEGVVIAVFDTGFKNLRHEAFGHLDILARWDFVNGDRKVGNGRDRGDGSHGAMVLSVLGGYAEGELVGPAFAATFLLAKTEDTESETPVEEDNWAAAAEWAEAWGADVISTSLGYLDFDSPFADYSFEDMDGETAVTTIAAQMAAERGVVVVASAGNQGFHPEHNTLGAPADGELVLSIGAVDSFGVRADFSSVGRTADGRIKPDVMAQGVLVKGIDPGTRDRYLLANGTSFSCPLAAGVAALLLQAHPDWPVTRVRRAMRSTADGGAKPTRLMGWGILDALKATRVKP